MTAHTKDRQPEVVESSMSLERKSKSNTKNEKDICTKAELGPYDILFGRSKTSFNNTGNRRFRVTVSMYLTVYLATKTKGEKSELFNSIHNFLENEVGARFLKPSTKNGEYIHLDKKKVRQKIGHALRDAAVNRHQFSTMAEWTTQHRNTSRRITKENEQQVEDDDESVIKPMQIESSSSQEREEQTKPILIESCPPQEQVVVPSSEHEIIKLVKKSFQDEGECCDDDTALLVSSSNCPITAPRTRPTFRRVVSIQDGDFVRGKESFQEEEDSSQSSCSTRGSSDNDDDSEDDHDEDSSIDSFLAELLAVDP